MVPDTVISRARRAAGAVLGRAVPMVEPRLALYAEDHTSRESCGLIALAEESRRATDTAYMMSGATQGHLLATLVHLGRPRHILEIGTFTGYSALAMAAALPVGGRITTCEIDPRNAEIAARHFADSPYAGQLDLRLGPALSTIDSLPGPFDFVFIDADKTGYRDYFEAVLAKLTDHAVIAVDNTLHGGLVAYHEDEQQMVEALLDFNRAIRDDPRVDQVMLTIRDGLTLIRPSHR